VQAGDALDAHCAATLLLGCADQRVWKLLSTEAQNATQTGTNPVFLSMLSRDDVRNAVRNNVKDEEKTLLAFKVCDHDAAPWIDL
jgi:hypothetical protein